MYGLVALIPLYIGSLLLPQSAIASTSHVLPSTAGNSSGAPKYDRLFFLHPIQSEIERIDGCRSIECFGECYGHEPPSPQPSTIRTLFICRLVCSGLHWGGLINMIYVRHSGWPYNHSMWHFHNNPCYSTPRLMWLLIYLKSSSMLLPFPCIFA